MKIGVIGKGFVGSAVYDGLGQLDHDMSFHDPKYDTNILDIKYTEIVFVSVPTDMREDGTCDTAVVESVLDQLTGMQYRGIVAIKSTIVPGTTRDLQEKFGDLNICCVPEFLRERSALTDFVLEHDVLVVGTTDENVATRVVRAHGNLPKQVRIVTPTEAELCKYFNNVFNALRITFANGFYDVCNNLDADYQKVYDAMTQRSNIDGQYLRVSKNLKYPLASNSWGDEEIEAIHSVIKSDMYTMGEKVKQFEKEFAAEMGCKHAVMVNSGSSANLIMLTAAKIKYNWGSNINIIVPSVAWSTTYYPVKQIGAQLNFVDVKSETMNIDPVKVGKAIDKDTKAILAVNLLGNPADMFALKLLAQIHNLC